MLENGIVPLTQPRTRLHLAAIGPKSERRLTVCPPQSLVLQRQSGTAWSLLFKGGKSARLTGLLRISLFRESRMKRIEAVITPFALDVFREAALRLGIAEFDVVQGYGAGRATPGRRRLYRGCESRSIWCRACGLSSCYSMTTCRPLCTIFLS
jgi:hypothetical protein